MIYVLGEPLEASLLFKKFASTFHEFQIVRNRDLCIGRKVCINQCTYEVHFWDESRDRVEHDNCKCSGCHRCAAMCPTGALTVNFSDSGLRSSSSWTASLVRSIYKQAENGSAHSAGSGCNATVPVYWDRLLIDAGQAGTPCKSPCASLKTNLTQNIEIDIPILLDKEACGNINLQAAMLKASRELGCVFNEGAAFKLSKINAVHDVADVALDAVRSGAEILIIGGNCRTGCAASDRFCKDRGIPLELAIAGVDQRLRKEGIRFNVSIIAENCIRCSDDVIKAIALGADAVNLDTAALIAVGCTLCGHCNTGKCPWGIATNDRKIVKRQNPEVAAELLVNLVRVWSYEIEKTLKSMELDSIKSLCGNRDKLRAIGLSEIEMNLLGVRHAGY